MSDTSPAAARRHIIDTLTARAGHGLTPTEAALLRAKIREEYAENDQACAELDAAKERARVAQAAALNLRAQNRTTAQHTLDQVRAARTWGDVWAQLGMYYGLSPEQAGEEARDRRTVAERTAERRAEKAEAELAEMVEGRDGMLRIIADWITQNDNAKTVDTNQLLWNLEDAGYPLPGLGLNEPDLAQSGVPTPGCDCGHDGMGRHWHIGDCAWKATGEETACYAEPPIPDAQMRWGDCWCTLPPGHDGEHRCQPCTDRHGAPGWSDEPGPASEARLREQIKAAILTMPIKYGTDSIQPVSPAEADVLADAVMAVVEPHMEQQRAAFADAVPERDDQPRGCAIPTQAAEGGA